MNRNGAISLEGTKTMSASGEGDSVHRKRKVRKRKRRRFLTMSEAQEFRETLYRDIREAISAKALDILEIIDDSMRAYFTNCVFRRELTLEVRQDVVLADVRLGRITGIDERLLSIILEEFNSALEAEGAEWHITNVEPCTGTYLFYIEFAPPPPAYEEEKKG